MYLNSHEGDAGFSPLLSAESKLTDIQHIFLFHKDKNENPKINRSMKQTENSKVKYKTLPSLFNKKTTTKRKHI